MFLYFSFCHCLGLFLWMNRPFIKIFMRLQPDIFCHWFKNLVFFRHPLTNIKKFYVMVILFEKENIKVELKKGKNIK